MGPCHRPPNSARSTSGHPPRGGLPPSVWGFRPQTKDEDLRRRPAWPRARSGAPTRPSMSATASQQLPPARSAGYAANTSTSSSCPLHTAGSLVQVLVLAASRLAVASRPPSRTTLRGSRRLRLVRFKVTDLRSPSLGTARGRPGEGWRGGRLPKMVVDYPREMRAGPKEKSEEVWLLRLREE